MNGEGTYTLPQAIKYIGQWKEYKKKTGMLIPKLF